MSVLVAPVTYRVVRKSDGAEVYQYRSEEGEPIEWHGMEFVTHDHDPIETAETVVESTTVFGGRRTLTKLEFVALLGVGFKAILSAAETDLDAKAFVKMVELATPGNDGYSIDLDDPRLEYGLRAFEVVGVIAAGETERILNG